MVRFSTIEYKHYDVVYVNISMFRQRLQLILLDTVCFEVRTLWFIMIPIVIPCYVNLYNKHVMRVRKLFSFQYETITYYVLKCVFYDYD